MSGLVFYFLLAFCLAHSHALLTLEEAPQLTDSQLRVSLDGIALVHVNEKAYFWNGASQFVKVNMTSNHIMASKPIPSGVLDPFFILLNSSTGVLVNNLAYWYFHDKPLVYTVKLADLTVSAAINVSTLPFNFVVDARAPLNQHDAIVILGYNYSLNYLQWVKISNGAVGKTINACGPKSQALSFQIVPDPANPTGPGLAITNCQNSYEITDLRTWTQVLVFSVAQASAPVLITNGYVALLDIDNYGTTHQSLYTIRVLNLLTKQIVLSKTYSFPDTFNYYPNYFESDGQGSIFLVVVRYNKDGQQDFAGSHLVMNTFDSTTSTFVDGGSWDTTQYYITWDSFIFNKQLFMWAVGNSESNQNLVKVSYST